jgi:predicted nucleotidyltransferase
VPDFAAAAEQAIRALVDRLHPLAIVWFGSASRGQAGPDSDLDFLVVLPRAAGERFDLFKQAQKAIWDVRAPIDLLIYYPDEVADKRDSLGSVVREAIETGRVVHGQV